MKPTIGRNAPCPCGSGKKAKHCHGVEGPRAESAHADGPAWAVAVEWLEARHGRALRESFSDFVMRELWPEDGRGPADYPEWVESDIAPWLMELWLACGEIRLGRRYHRPCELAAFGLSGQVSAAVIEELRLLGETPLRLYRIVGRTEGRGWQLVDALDLDCPPWVLPDSEPEGMRAGDLVAARLVGPPEEARRIGVYYGFPADEEIQVMNAVRETEEEDYEEEEDRVWNAELEIGAQWLRFCLASLEGALAENPTEVDSDEDIVDDGPDLLNVTDHFEVLDAERLAELLDDSPDLRADLGPGWLLRHDNALGLEPAAIEIVSGSRPGRLELVYPSLSDAEAGRTWFEAFAADTVRYLTREISASEGALDRDILRELESLPADQLNELLGGELARQALGAWLDAPSRELDGATPRAAVADEEGAARVRALLQSLQGGANVIARKRGLEPLDIGFLWEELGLRR